ASPFSNPGLNYDLRLVAVNGGLQAQLSDAAAALLRPEFRRALCPATSPTGREVKALEVAALFPRALARLTPGFAARTAPERLACYALVMAAGAEVAGALLAPVQTVVSEIEPPYSAHAGGGEL